MPVYRTGATVAVGSRPVLSAGGVVAPTIGVGPATFLGTSPTLNITLSNNDPDNPSVVELAFDSTDPVTGDSVVVAQAWDHGDATTPSFALDPGLSRPIVLVRGPSYTAYADPAITVSETVTATLADGSSATPLALTCESIATIPTDYANPGGTGNRIATIVASQGTGAGGGPFLYDSGQDPVKLVNSSTANEVYYNPSTNVGAWMEFDFGGLYRIDEFRHKQSTTNSHNTHKWEARETASDAWTVVSANFTLGGATTSTHALTTGGGSAYRYYRIVNVSGQRSSNPWILEYEFKISLVQ